MLTPFERRDHISCPQLDFKWFKLLNVTYTLRYAAYGGNSLPTIWCTTCMGPIFQGQETQEESQ
jgi:hypothetical protein